MALLESPENIVNSFFHSLRTERTEQVYRYGISRVLPNPASFLALADENRWKAQEQLITWIRMNKDIGAHAIKSYIDSTRALCNYAELQLSWKKIYSACPPVPKPRDEAPPIEAIKKIYEQGDLRFRAIVHIFMSAPRVGAFDHFTRGSLEELKVGKTTIGRLIVYEGHPEQYDAFVTDEGLSVLKKYFDYRETMGEKIEAKSPLIRNAINPFPKRGQHSTIKALTSKSVQMLFRDASLFLL